MASVLGIVKERQLVPEDTWKKFISTLSTPFERLETNKERSKRQLSSLLIDAVKKRLTKKTGILLSGGVDSSTLAFISHKLNAPQPCYTAGLTGSQDIEWAKKMATLHSLTLRQKILSLEELESIVKEVIKITGQNDIVTVGVGAVTYTSAQMAKEDGCFAIMTGLGSEELFAGYERHLKAWELGYEAVHNECISGLSSMRTRDLWRDFSIADHFGLELSLPFLDKEIMKAALAIHPMSKIGQSQNKIVLRELSEGFGLQKEFAQRKKKAAQYGSSVVSGVETLSKRKGFKSKKEYLESLS
jgi:asparagine synthase (glutamine-hydrolysing)